MQTRGYLAVLLVVLASTAPSCGDDDSGASPKDDASTPGTPDAGPTPTGGTDGRAGAGGVGGMGGRDGSSGVGGAGGGAGSAGETGDDAGHTSSDEDAGRHVATCGDGTLDAGEECDDANRDDTDGCVDCAYARCGDGAVRRGIEQCDEGDRTAGDGCSPTCRVEVCGNGVLDDGEECDDDGDDSGDGCSGPGSPLGECQIERCGDGAVNDGESCDRAATPATCNLDCTVSTCGDGKINPSALEQCDDENSDVDDGCYGCLLTRCGNDRLDPGEECDGVIGAGTYGCSAGCFQIVCGNGRLDPGEACDDGNSSNDDNCISADTNPTSCVPARCGDGHTDQALPGIEACDAGANNAYTGDCLPSCQENVCGDGFQQLTGLDAEVCDDGNTDDEVVCPYGTAGCFRCNAQCSATLSLSGNVCGDGGRDLAHEECDDGNLVYETRCEYGSATCDVCTPSCTSSTAIGAVCGDGSIDPPYETCDDGNTSACGQCSADCQLVQLAYATGLIVVVPGAELFDGETFTISDGVGTTVVFELDDDDSVWETPVAYRSIDTADVIASLITSAIALSELQLQVERHGALIELTNVFPTSLGNVAITEAVSDPYFYVSGMSGGAGRDCPSGTGCANDGDCASLSCGFPGPPDQCN